MGSNDIACRNLCDVLMRKGRALPSTCKTMEAQVYDAVDKLQRAANNLMFWDGRASGEISSDASRARHDYLWGDGGPVPENARAAQRVADIDAASTYRATVQNVIGDGVSMSVVDALG